MIDFVGIPSLLQRTGISCIDCCTVLDIDCINKSLISGTEFLRLETENPVDFIRPEEAIFNQVKLPATQMSNLLCPLQTLLTDNQFIIRFAQRRLCLLALGNIIKNGIYLIRLAFSRLE